MFDFAVVGSGIGGSSIAALLSKKGYRVVMFEKDSNLGGCSGTFHHKGFLYSTGATTLAGYEEGHVVKEIFDQIGITPALTEEEVGMCVLHNGKITKRYRELDRFVSEVDKNYPHKKNEQFWKLVFEINREFHKVKNYRYSNKNLFAKYFSLLSFLPLGWKFRKYLFRDALDFIKEYYKEPESDYIEFLEAQVFIVTQAKLKEINFFTAAVALAYTFNKNYHVVGGFQKLFKELSEGVSEVHKKTEVKLIEKREQDYQLHTDRGEFLAKSVILNSTVYQSDVLFDDQSIKKELSRYKTLDNYQSTFVFYMTLKTDRKFMKHYQLIKEKCFSNSLSNALFVSFSDDFEKGLVSVTASLHTDYRIWYDNYKQKKKTLQNEIFEELMSALEIDKESVLDSFSATPMTYKRYINRTQVGGNAILMKNYITKLPSNDTAIKGLYRVGDTTFAAQGWPGVMMGVRNLARLLDV
ncbi:MAG: FAD-dependent oxidoreductase [Sulfurimonas sp.]